MEGIRTLLAQGGGLRGGLAVLDLEGVKRLLQLRVQRPQLLVVARELRREVGVCFGG